MEGTEAKEIAKRIFTGRRYKPTDEEIERLSSNICLLRNAGLDKLNKRLIEGGRKVWDTFVEHNFAAELISLHGSSIAIEYEPDSYQRPPDFRISFGDRTFWFQIKNPSDLERNNRLNKMMQDLKRFALEIPIGKFFGCSLSPNFNKEDLENLKQFLPEVAKVAVDGEEYHFPDEKMSVAKITFWSSERSEIFHLTMGVWGDMEAVNITGLAMDQIGKSINNAASAFAWVSDKININIVAMDAGGFVDIDICDAIFGTEYDFDRLNGYRVRHGWCRIKNGLFLEEGISQRVAGVIALKRKEKYSPVSEYKKVFYVNERHLDDVNDINRLIPFSILARYNMRPPMGKGNFNGV